MNLEELDKLMEVSNLYEILGIEKDASGANIKKNYYKLALKYHPDKLPHADEYVKGEASKYFNRVQIAYNILSDKERRARYDTTGVVPEFEGESGDSDLTTNPINEEDIKNFAKEYLDSEQEIQDLIALNEQFEGDVNEIMIRAILRENEDEDKVVQIIKDAIEAGKTEEYSKFKSSLTAVQKLKRKRTADREKKQFSKGKNKKEKSPDIGELYQMILAKKEKRGSSFLDDLEARYCKPKKGKKETVPTDAEIDEIVKKNKQKESSKTKKGNKSSNTEVIEIFEEEDQLGNTKGKRGKKGNKTSNVEVIEIFDENDQTNSKGRKSKRNSKPSNAEVIELN